MEFLLLYTFIGFAGMEIASYVIHRYIFHGFLWSIHQTHHKPSPHLFEWNDLFSLFFAGISIFLLITGRNSLASWQFGTGLGTAFYGILYFIIHDLFAHKRFIPLKSDNKLMHLIKKAHQNHHQSVEKEGQEPYGLFLFPYKGYEDRIR